MPHHLLAAEDWVTRDDMAVLMRKSLDTVKRVHEKHNLETKKDEAGRVLVNVGDYLELGRLKPEDLTAGATPAESVEVLRARQTIHALKVQIAEAAVNRSVHPARGGKTRVDCRAECGN